MYRVDIVNNGTVAVLHENSPNSMRRLASCTFTEGVNHIGSCDFALYKQHPEFDNMTEITTLVKITNTQTNEVEFEGRIAQIDGCGMDSTGVIAKKCHCEGLMAYLYDTIQMYQNYEDKTPAQFLAALVANHNAQVSSDKQISDVYCEVTGNTHSKTTAYRSTLDEIKENLISRIGGELALRRNASGDLVLYYFNDGGDGAVKPTKVELARNMVSLKQDVDATSVVTRLIPLGAQLTDDSAERLTLSEDTYPTKWIDDTEAMAIYGVIVGVAEFDDITVEANLLAAGRAALAANNAVKYSYQAEVLDLSTIGEDDFAFRSGNSYEFINAMTGFDEVLRLQTRTVDIYEPYKPRVTIGEKVKTITSAINKTKQFINTRIPEIKSDILSAAKASASSMINNAVAGYVVFHDTNDDGQPDELLIMDTMDIATATKVWRWNSGGLGYSSTGYMGTYGTAITADGQVTADAITTGTLNSIAIRSGDDGEGNFTFTVDTSGNVVANSLTSNNATITGGSIHVNADSQNYDFISLNYENQMGATWHSEMTPLQVKLTNTDTNYEFTMQSAGAAFKNITTGNVALSVYPSGVSVRDDNTGNEVARVTKGTATIDGVPTTVGIVRSWNGGEWVTLNSVASQARVNAQNIQTLWDAVFS